MPSNLLNKLSAKSIADFFKRYPWQIAAAAGFVVIAFLLLPLFHHGEYSEEDGHEHGEHGHGDHDEHGKEGKLEISEIAQELSKLEILKAEKRAVVSTIKLNGRITPNQDRLAQIASRYPGVVKKVFKELGDPVRAGESLAEVEANGSLSTFSLKSKIAGTLIGKNIVSGEFVSDQEILFEVSDLSTVWVDINVTEQDFGKIKVGDEVVVRLWDGVESYTTNVTYVSPMVHSDSQTLLARAVVDNNSGVWRPGSFVTAEVTVKKTEPVTAVSKSALQFLDNSQIIFVRNGDEEFEVRPVLIGNVGRDYVEVKDGLSTEEQYVAKNSFILKAELLKSLAAHDHGH